MFYIFNSNGMAQSLRNWENLFSTQCFLPNHTVLAISTKSPENKDLEILYFLIKIDFNITFTL